MKASLLKGATILFVSASPKDQPRIGSDVEQRTIDDSIRGHFKLVTKLAAQPQDVVHALAEHKPQIVHFSGHGTGKQGLVFQDANERMVLFSKKALESLLAADELMEPVLLVVLNACWTTEQAKLIARRGTDTIGVKIDVLDEVAKAFAGSFYRLLCHLTPRGAFDAAIAAMDANALPETDAPEFHAGKRTWTKPRPPEQTADQFQTDHLPLKLALLDRVDRSKQISLLPKSVEPQRPLLLFIPGTQSQCPDRFMERLCASVLPELLARDDKGMDRRRRFSWPENAKTKQECQAHWEFELPKVLRGNVAIPGVRPPPPPLTEALGCLLRPAVVWSEVLNDQNRSTWYQELEWFLEWWSQPQRAAFHSRAVVCLCFNLDMLTFSRVIGWFTRIRLSRRINDLLADLARSGRFAATEIVALPELSDVRPPEVLEWARDEDPYSYWRDDSEQVVRKISSECGKPMPMLDVRAALGRILEQHHRNIAPLSKLSP